MTEFLKSWKGIAAAIATAIGLLTTGVTTAFKLDSRYAHAGQVQSGLKTLESGQLRSERRYLRDKINDYEVLEQSRQLTPADRKRLRELRDDLKDVEERIQELRK